MKKEEEGEWRGGKRQFGGKRRSGNNIPFSTYNKMFPWKWKKTVPVKALCKLYRTLQIPLVFANLLINIFRSLPRI